MKRTFRICDFEFRIFMRLNTYKVRIPKSEITNPTFLSRLLHRLSADCYSLIGQYQEAPWLTIRRT